MAAAQRLDCVILNGTVVSPHGRFKANVGIREGRITVLTRSPLNGRKNQRVRKLLLPGLVDPHGHMAHAWTNGDAFRNETRRMILGGVTSYLDYPAGSGDRLVRSAAGSPTSSPIPTWTSGSSPSSTALEILSELEQLFKNMGFFVPVFLRRAGARTLSSHLRPERRGPASGLRDRLRPRATGPRVRPRGKLGKSGGSGKGVTRKRAHGRAGLDGRSPPHLRRGIHRAGPPLCRPGNMPPLHCPHRPRKGTELLERAKGRGVDVVGETCPHYLSMHRGHRLIGPAKFNPAVKLKKDQDEIWEAVVGRGLDCIGSDHIASTGQEEGFVDKDKDIWNAWAGLPGSGTIPVHPPAGVRKRDSALKGSRRSRATIRPGPSGFTPARGTSARGPTLTS